MQVSFSILRANGETGKVYNAEGDVVVFGRSDECDVQLDDGYVSSRHAEIQCIDGRFYLQDLKSTNGTWLKENRVDGRIPIADNAVIEFGKGGPKVRIVSLLGQGTAAASAFTSETSLTRKSLSPGEPYSKRLDTTRPSSTNVRLQLAACIAAGGLAIIAGIFLIRPLLKPSDKKLINDSHIADALPQPENASGGGESSGEAPAVNSTISQTSPVDFEKIAKQVQDQSVWIGLKVKSGDQVLIFPLCNGWIYSNSLIVATGSVIADLEADRESSEIVVYSNRLPDTDPFITVKSMKIHPGFVTSAPASSASLENNLGLLELSRPLPESPLNQPVEVDIWRKAFNAGTSEKLIQCGYSVSLKPEPISALSMPEFAWSKISKGEVIPGSSMQSLPLIRISIDKAMETRSGHVVINADGKIFGTLLHIDETNAMLIPIDRIPQLLSSAASHAP